MKKRDINPIVCSLIAFTFLIPLLYSAEKGSKITPLKLLENLEKGTFTGEQINVTLENVDLIQAIKELLDPRGLPYIIEGDIKGKVTLKKKSVPWDQALALIMNDHDLHLSLIKHTLKIQKIKMSKRMKDRPEEKRIFGKPSRKYRGELGEFIFNRADLQNVIIFFARTYHFNVVIDPGISGKVTCRMIQVPWDQALEIILLQHGLAMVWEGKVVQIKDF